MSASDRVEFVRASFPEEGLFRGKEWRISPEPFPLSPALMEQLHRLGPALHAFNRACNRLYYESVEGTQPKWVAELLDRGKPKQLVDLGRFPAFADEVPRVIRPDIIISERGATITELDTLPGGIGVTGWMNLVYTELGNSVIGGETGMIDGLADLMEGGDLIISPEGQDYKPEMLWITREIRRRRSSPDRFRVIDTADYSFSDVRSPSYRFFELWDLPNVPHGDRFLELALNGTLRFTPPLKAFLEEKLWLALFWSIPLRDYWENVLGAETCQFLRERIPYGWVVNPEPIPPFAEIPKLHISAWPELGEVSHAQRQVALKISGFSEKAWGSRGVSIGHDLSKTEWKSALAQACEEFASNPYILQEFEKGVLFDHPYAGDEDGELKIMHGRVRLCPYYFVIGEEARLGGVMATICPADKKLIHGMKDAIIVPCVAA